MALDQQGNKKGCISMLRKTKMCDLHVNGNCPQGANCKFAHCSDELKLKPDLSKTCLCIRFRTRRGCKEGQNCRFAHSRKELRSQSNVQATSETADFDPSVVPFRSFFARASIKPVGLQGQVQTRIELIDEAEVLFSTLVQEVKNRVTLSVKNGFYHFEERPALSVAIGPRSSSAPPSFKV
jgi:hypothetical protein